ncbi:hypothetical protein H5410_060621 [Solanum commersonii]|uniref:Uncharacterized protein n=1 Tax=Solanum commersonii TaxID=4109 RepID=A0A9J5W668_SOLCO|nr:hypothetical protein H5410_060621 [Solanum commersonii]
MDVYHNLINLLVQEKIYEDFKSTYFGHLRHIPEHFKFNGQMFHYMLLRRLSVGKESFNLTLTYLKNKINLKRESEVYNERGNASFGYMRLFLILESMPRSLWILLCPFPIYLDGTPQKMIILLKVIHLSTKEKVVHPYLTPIVRETKKNYLVILKPYIDEVKDTILNTFKANLKNVIVLTSVVENVEDEYLLDDDNFLAPTVDDKILPLAIVDDDLVVVDEYFAEEVDEVLEENDEEKEEEKLDEKKEEKSEEGKLEGKKNEASGQEEKEQQEEKITENEEEEKLDEEKVWPLMWQKWKKKWT